MSLADWVRNTTSRVRADGIEGAVESGRGLYRGGWRLLGSRLPLGTNVYDREWDLLVVLDGCRTDLLRAAANDHAFLGNVGTAWSVGSSSREWLAKTFAPRHRKAVAETAYVSANPYTDDILSPGGADGNSSPFNPANWPSLSAEEFLVVEEVWRDSWDDDLGTVAPRTVTDAAIRLARERSPGRLVVHYMQPHQPFVPLVEAGDPPAWADGNCWQALRRGDVSRTQLWDAYRANLDLVLEDVELLLDSVDADRAVITADHGNAVGEWGLYGHPNGALHPSVKRVPWVETTASDTGGYVPGSAAGVAATDDDTDAVSDRLESLGYL
jgi:hypothetical protein